MNLTDVLHQIAQDSMEGYGLSDMTIGTVTSTKPLKVKIREGMADIPQEALRLTAAVIEKKIPVLEHAHITEGFRHDHAFPSLSHSHSTEEGETGTALEDALRTETGLDPDAYTSDKQLLKQDIVCYEDGKPLPVKDGYIILNRALEAGDKVLLLRVMRGQQFIILSRVYEKEA
ncbi:MAG: DUF2577 domain-containing protein [Oscillospiraceae bacterium]|nr:DUF2577 domain-containing protein [Oscillospiraceae bacterium]